MSREKKVFPGCRDKHGTPLQFGDEVYYYIPGHGSNGGYGLVIGIMSYAENAEDIVCLAGAGVTGMPINTAHTQRTSAGSIELAVALREKYLKMCPTAFKPLPETKGEVMLEALEYMDSAIGKNKI